MILGLWEDDTGNVLKSTYTDYPLIRVLLVVFASFFILNWLLKKIQKSTLRIGEKLSVIPTTFLALLLTGLFIIGLRGSFGTFPIQMDDANVSSNPKVNLLAINGVFALKNVLTYAVLQRKLDEFDKEIKNIGFADKEYSYKKYFGDSINLLKNDYFFNTTFENPIAKQNPPNVVFFLMESMSNNNLDLQSNKLNVLGALEKYFKEGIVFRKFLPAQNGTINSIEALTVNTPITSIAQSKFGSDTFQSATAKPFYDNGYETTFITGGKLNWRNINTFIPRQYFKNIEGDGDIKAANPMTQECEWGVYDEFLFDHVYNKLANAKKPQFIFALSTTNHTPFHLPEHYKPYSVSLNDSIRKILKVEEDRAIKNLTNFQYSNDCLGKFLDKLKNSEYGDNTIVFATGDHNNLMLFDFTTEQLYYKLSVPLLMYIPEKYMANSTIDTSRWGSHKDIFPTLYNLALSNATYFNAGANLLAKDKNNQDFYAMDVMSYIAMNDNGVVKFDGKPATYNWFDQYHLTLTKTDTSNALLLKSRAYFATMYHYIKSDRD